MYVRVVIAALAVASTCARAHAQDVPVLNVSVNARRPIVATHGEDPSASGTSLNVLERVTIPRSLGDVVREAPGAQVFNTGGVGAFTTLSLRGAGGDENLVLLDEIPLSTSDGGAFDLSLFPADLFQTVNVFRGGAPVWLGSGSIGGVLQLVPRREDRNGLNASLGAGSFGTYQLNAGSEVALNSRLTSHSQLVVRGSENNYRYTNDGTTTFVRSDDRTFTLKNGKFEDISGFQDVTIPLKRGELHLLAIGLVRGGGFPGPLSKPTPRVTRENTRVLTAASYTLRGGTEERFARKLQLIASASYGADRFRDIYAQYGISQPTNKNNLSLRTFLRAAGTLAFTRWLEGSLIASYAQDAYAPHDNYATDQPGSGRKTFAGATELNAHGKIGSLRYELRPSARLEWSQTNLHAPASYTRGSPGETTRLVPTTRVGGALELMHGLALSASWSSGTRLPALYELFGDGGTVLPAVDLRPVKSKGVDGGVTYKRRIGAYAMSLEARAFWQQRRDTIVAEGNANKVIYSNIASVHQYGAESRASVELTRWFSTSGSFTYLETEDARGKQLPFRPRFMGYVRSELRVPVDAGFLTSIAFATDLWHRSFSFFDSANQSYTPACTKLGFGASMNMFADVLRFSARMDDALDQRCFDLVGFPLPGRALFFTLSYREGET